MNKILLIISSFSICTSSFALSCPHTGKLLETDYSSEQTLQICGRPLAANHYKDTTILSEEWVYFKNLQGGNIKITLTFSHRQLTNINILDTQHRAQICQATNQFGQIINVQCAAQEQNLASSTICGSMLQTGYSVDQVRSACGNPITQKTINSITDDYLEFKYQGAGPTVLVFKNNKLIDWTYEFKTLA